MSKRQGNDCSNIIVTSFLTQQGYVEGHASTTTEQGIITGYG